MSQTIFAAVVLNHGYSGYTLNKGQNADSFSAEVAEGAEEIIKNGVCYSEVISFCSKPSILTVYLQLNR